MSMRSSGVNLVLSLVATALGLVACATGGGGATSQGGESAQGGSTAESVTSTGAGVIVGATSSTTGATTTSAASSASSTGAGGSTSCDVLTADSCGDCVESACCVELLACKNDASCWSCFTDAGASGCGSNAAFVKVATCVVGSCGPVIVPGPGGEGPSQVGTNPCHFAPAGWTCDTALYDQGYKTPSGPVVCNCECGSFRDPDCVNMAADDCGAGMLCTAHCGCIPDDAGCQ